MRGHNQGKHGKQVGEMVVRKIFLALLFGLLFHGASAEFSQDPLSVSSVTTDVEITGNVKLYGGLKPGDYAEVKVFTFREREDLRVYELEEKLFIGDREIEAEHKTDELGNLYAFFEVPGLNEKEFSYSIKAKVKTNARKGLSDFVLEKGITGKNAWLQETELIQSNSKEIKEIAEQFSGKTFLETLAGVSQWTYENMTYDEEFGARVESAVASFEVKRGVCDEYSNLSAAILRSKGIPTKFVVGIAFDGKEFSNHAWLKVFSPEDGWIPFDSTFNEAGIVDGTHIPFGELTDVSAAVDEFLVPQGIELELEKRLSVKVLNHEKFSGMIAFEHSSPEVAGGSKGKLDLKLRNLKHKHLIVPVKVSFHEKFEKKSKDKLLVLEPRKFGTASFEFVAPENGEKKIFYGFLAKSLNEELNGRILVDGTIEKPEPGNGEKQNTENGSAESGENGTGLQEFGLTEEEGTVYVLASIAGAVLLVLIAWKLKG